MRYSNRSGSHINCFRFTKGEKGGCTWEHEFRKFQICWELASRGHEFMTEPIFNNGKRADVVDLTAMVVYEVLASEKIDSCAVKIESYPDCFEVRMVSALVEWNPKLLD